MNRRYINIFYFFIYSKSKNFDILIIDIIDGKDSDCMKKTSFLIGALSLLSLIPFTYKATCTDEYITTQANNIQFNRYAFNSTEKTKMISGFSIDNIPDDMFVTVVNVTDNTKVTHKDFENGMIEVEVPDPKKIYTYQFRIYSTDQSCENELIRRVEMKNYVYNKYALSSECSELSEKELSFEGCELFTEKIYSADMFYKELDEFKESLDKEPEKEVIKDKFYANTQYFLIPVAFLGVYYVIRLLVIKRRKKKSEQE